MDNIRQDSGVRKTNGKKAALIYNIDNTQAHNCSCELVVWGQKHGVDFYVAQSGRGATVLKENTDFAVVLGGDGTFLRAARLTFGKKIPLYGVNFGHLGFLATGDLATLKQDIAKIIAGEYTLTEREVIKAEVIREGKTVRSVQALNDVVISKSNVSRMTNLQVSVNGELLSVFRSDGIILSTPTGSTAYALSAGGPVIPPEVSCLLLVPICAHTLFARPVVLDGKAKTAVKILAGNTDICLTHDGQAGYPLLCGDIVEAELEKTFKVYTIAPKGSSYYDLLRRKLSWGFDGTKGERQA